MHVLQATPLPVTSPVTVEAMFVSVEVLVVVPAEVVSLVMVVFTTTSVTALFTVVVVVTMVWFRDIVPLSPMEVAESVILLMEVELVPLPQIQ